MTTWGIEKIILVLIIAISGHTTAAQTKAEKLVQQVSEPSGPQEGMSIHGHWTVTVRNSDGTIASRHEFENSVTNTGKGIVLGFLSGSSYPMKSYVPSWELKIGENLCGKHTPGDCLIPVQAQLVVGGKVEMKGTITIDYAGQIKSVATQITNTINQVNSPIVFSSHDLTQQEAASSQPLGPISVQAGQNVDFIVDISIS